MSRTPPDKGSNYSPDIYRKDESDELDGLIIATGWPTSSWEPVRTCLERSGLHRIASSGRAGGENILVGFQRAVHSSGNSNVEMVAQQLAEDLPPAAAVQEPQVLARWAITQRNTTFLIFYSRFQDALARALERDEDPDDFGEDWWRANLAMLNFQRANRSRCLVFDCEAVLLHALTFDQICAKQGLDLSLQVSRLTPHSELTLPRALDVLIAQNLLGASPKLARLDAELEATAFPLRSGTSNELPLSVLLSQDLRERRAARAQESGIQKALDDSMRNLRRELADYQAQLEQATQAKASAEKTAAEQKTQIEQLTQAKQQAEAQTAEKQKQLEQANQAKVSAEKRAVENETRATLLHENAEARKREKDEADDENELLLHQLHMVQEELESYFFKHQNAESRVSGLQQKNDELRQRAERSAALVAEHEDKGKHLTERITRLRGQVAGLEKELGFAQAAAASSLSSADEMRARLRIALAQVENALTALMAPTRRLPSLALVRAAQTSVSAAWRFRGWKKRRTVSRSARRLILQTSLFDSEWYLARNPDVLQARMHPVDHFLEFGAKENRDPSAGFSLEAYSAANSLSGTDINPLLHYLLLNRETES